jgi:hypothetical protein
MSSHYFQISGLRRDSNASFNKEVTYPVEFIRIQVVGWLTAGCARIIPQSTEL